MNYSMKTSNYVEYEMLICVEAFELSEEYA